jgi:hypothetical protein
VRVRIVAAAAAAALAVAGLTGCQSGVGSAASVGSHKIGESSVDNNVTPSGVSPSAAAQAQAAGQTIPPPKGQVLSLLIQQELFERTLDNTGGVPSDAQLTASQDTATKTLTGQTVSAADLEKTLPEFGVKASFVPTYLRVLELEYALVERKKLTQLTDLVTLIDKQNLPVTVNPRYGTWKPSALSVSGTAAVPGFLDVQSAAAAPAGGSTG